MKNIIKKTLLIIVGAIILLVGGLVTFRAFDNSKYTMYEVKEYNPMGICDSITPECGYCTGEVVDRKCYVRIKRL